MDNSSSCEQQRGPWIGTCLLLLAHLAAFGMLYLVVVQMNWAFQDFLKVVGVNPTPRFQSAAVISDWIAAYTPVVLLVLAVHLFAIFRLSRRRSHWASVYSHVALLAMGAVGFLWTAWGVQAMTWGQPGIADAQELVTDGTRVREVGFAESALSRVAEPADFP